ncbi:lipid II flippase MurJ [Telmatobacter bradus]|uniref:lipid II flippase MurJ n=1 Tax=Telmatobacter bradus TaxID=474953 RepID=UPI003B42CB3E
MSTAAQSPVHGRILRAATSVALAGVFVKLVATLKEAAVAGVYGRSNALDAFLAAALLPTLLVNLIGESMNQALVPTLIMVREREGHEQAQRLLAAAMLWLCLLLTATSLLLALLARGLLPLFASNFPPEKLQLAIHLFYALLPVVLITGIATNCTAVANSCERFALPALAPVVISLAILAGVWGCGGRLGIWALVWATLAGSLGHMLLVAGLMQRHGYRFQMAWYGMSAPVREVGRQYGPVLVSGVVASAGLVVDQAMAAMLPAGSVSALVYASRFVSVVLTLFAGAISTAVVPYFSRMIAQQDWQGCRDAVETWVWRMGAVALAVTLALVAGAHLLIRLFLQHGVFHADDTDVVARVLVLYALQIPFFVASRVDYRLLVAMRRTDLVMACGTINLVLDVVLNLVLMRWLGVAGIALATSLWVVSTFFFLRFWSRRLLGRELAKAGQGSASAARYLLRLDDLCPTMKRERWQRFEQLIEAFGLQPILAVVPDNQDPDLECDSADPDFWPKMRTLEARGASIALHGLRHLPVGHGGGLLPLHQQTEFAGVEAETQFYWVGEGLHLLREHGLNPRLWVAPRHGSDQATLAALRAHGIEVVSDGFSQTPYRRMGLIWLPQQLWEPVVKQEGVWTICMHPNTATDAQMERLQSFVQEHAAQFVGIEAALMLFPPHAFGWQDLFTEKKRLVRIQLSRAWRTLEQIQNNRAV